MRENPHTHCHQNRAEHVEGARHEERCDEVVPIPPEELLNEASVEVHVDDFGTGYSSLSYLSRLPIAGLKIDSSFVAQMTNSREDMEVVRTITSLGKGLYMAVIAEGVETERQLEKLRALGCQYGQGFLFGRPLPAAEVTQLLCGSEAGA